ncbi:MAG: hypothetical protein IT556_09690 [Acetobacteraceae bacterium]|nr:hypothetical protein [Acetobacteraceae bacterium]
MVTYIRSDLDFILDQIRIAEAHSAGVPLFGPGGQIPAPNLSWGLRTVDGTYNNLLPGRELWGSADQVFPERLQPVFRDGEMFDPDGPGGPSPAGPTSYDPSDDPGSIVVDSSVRTISNLIVDQSINNPSAVRAGLIAAGLADAGLAAALAAFDAAPDAAAKVAVLESHGVSVSVNPSSGEATIFLPNVAPDEGLSAEFNSWFTLFGQFFDHGLDLVDKGGSGTVFIPLNADDPLFDPTPGAPNFMLLTRASVSAGDDGIMGTPDDVRPINRTTSFVDQNQTYASHPSHQVFLREYALEGGVPRATGQLIEGASGGMSSWADVKAQALLLGILLTDEDVTNVPLLATDPYGNFIPGTNGFAQVVFPGANPGDPPVLVEGIAGGLSVAGAVRTGHAFLADIAHEAAPGGGKLADSDSALGLDNGGNPAPAYDDELLDAHVMAGDGRANENFGLTAVHHVFHSEHNRLVEHTKQVVLESGDLAFLNEWLDTDVAVFPLTQPAIDALDWHGERLFQAAKFGTEMQYQHLVFEEFARKVQPQVDVFVVPDGFDPAVNPTIVAEFAHVVYRFGHSMLTESVDRYDENFNADHLSLINAFLNPVEFDSGYANADAAAGAVVRGMTRQTGNEIDEFVTGALRNNLLGLPLDLATINLARGRDAGVPSLNAARREFFESTSGDVRLKPYESWVEFAQNLKNEWSAINFLAAYGTHATITGATTIEAKRDAAMAIVFGGPGAPADAQDFLNGTGAWGPGVGGLPSTGLESIDLWIGGLAEAIMPFGGMLGSTFNYVFETQMESLQNGDRFYYLQRLDGLHLFGEMENNSFASLIMRNTNATHLPGDVFAKPAFILEVDQGRQFNEGLGQADPTGGSIFTPEVIRNNPATPGPDTNYLRYTGGEHVVLGGTGGNDILVAGIGDDTLWGDGGNDRLDGGHGNDIINGGDGDDIITDLGGDDNIKAGDGNDAVNSGQGLNLVLGGAGTDFIVTGPDAGTEVFAGTGNDFILGSKVVERILGNEGNDWIEIGTFDGAPGDNFDEIFARDQIAGHDIFLGDGGFDEFIAEGGDDVMVGSEGRGKMVGMSGYDWATYKDFARGIDADLTRIVEFDEVPTPPPNAALDTFEAVEGLSGSRFNDLLTGSDVTAATIGLEGFQGSVMDAAGVARIVGLQALLGAAVNLDGSFDAGNVILGGGGSDVITGLAGDDIIDGDQWLNVRISVRANPDGTGAELESHNSMTTLVSKVFSGLVNPGQLIAVREIVDGGQVGDIDVARYLGPQADYDIIANPDNSVTVVHARGTQTDGTDTLYNVERAQFADGFVQLNNEAATGAPTISDSSPTEGQLLTATLGTIADADGTTTSSFVFTWQAFNGIAWVNVGGGTTFTPTQAQVNQMLRVMVSFTDDEGGAEAVASAPTIVVGDLFVGTAAANLFNGTEGDDNAQGLGGADTLIGNGGDDILDGGAQNDVLDGGEGNDTLIGGTGTDAMTGGNGDDTYHVNAVGDTTSEAGTGGVDTVISSVSWTLGANFENLQLIGGGNTTGIGNELANVITANGGNNTLNGGLGADSMAGGGGNDTYVVDDIGDSVTEAGASGTDTVQSSISYSLGANLERLTLTGAGNIDGTGNGQNNLLNGNGGNNVLDGGVGDDTMNGGGGNDTIIVDSAGDIVNGGAGTDTVQSSVTFLLGATLENLTLTGTGAISGTGNGAVNVMTGNSANNTLNGAGGADTLDGGEGDDTLIGGAAADVFVFGPAFGSDTINDFDANPAGGQDLLNIAALGITAATFAASVLVTDLGDHTDITIAGAGSILLNNVNGVGANAITQADFILA